MGLNSTKIYNVKIKDDYYTTLFSETLKLFGSCDRFKFISCFNKVLSKQISIMADNIFFDLLYGFVNYSEKGYLTRDKFLNHFKELVLDEYNK